MFNMNYMLIVRELTDKVNIFGSKIDFEAGKLNDI